MGVSFLMVGVRGGGQFFEGRGQGWGSVFSEGRGHGSGSVLEGLSRSWGQFLSASVMGGGAGRRCLSFINFFI